MTTTTETTTPTSTAAHPDSMTSTTEITANQQVGLRCIEALHRAGCELYEVAEATGLKSNEIAVRLFQGGSLGLNDIEDIANLTGVDPFVLLVGEAVVASWDAKAAQ